MKRLIPFLLVAILGTTLNAQESKREVRAKVTEATLYINGAFLKHSATVKLPAGKTVIRFTGISPYFDQKSVRVSGEGDLTILGVNAQLNIEDSTGETKEGFDFNGKISELTRLNEEAQVRLAILAEQEGFLQTNKVVSSAQEPGEAGDIMELAAYYDKRISELRIEKLRLDREVRERSAEIQQLRNQQAMVRPEVRIPEGEIVVTVSAETKTEARFDLRYFTDNANWFPGYDIRVDEVGKPVQVIYKATLRQQTGTEWKDIKLRFSNATPRESGRMPQLVPYYLEYQSPSTYEPSGAAIDPNIRNLSGRVYDAETGEPLMGAVVMVEGTSVGTISDMEGNYSLSIPANSQRIIVRYVGYRMQTNGISTSHMDFAMHSEQAMLDAVVVSQSLQRMPGVVVGKVPAKFGWFGGSSSYEMPVSSSPGRRSVNLEMEIAIPYSVSKDGRPITIDLKQMEIPAFFEYQVTPKLDESAYLFAGLVDWEQYQLLDGEANVYFENTFIGKTVLNPTQLTDTLMISLGKDQGIMVQRNKVRERIRRQMIGKDRIESLAYETVIRNTKDVPISIKVFDQYPLTVYKDISIELTESSGGVVDERTGGITWRLDIPPRTTEKRLMEYTVKFPKERRVYLY